MNETLYKNALGLEPVDTIFLSETPLQDYYIICDSKERAELAKKTNPGATIIVFPKDKINNSGNMILQCLDRGIFYKNHPHITYDMITDHMEW